MTVNRRTWLLSLPAVEAAFRAVPAAAQSGDRIRIGATANDSFAEAYYAQDNGFFTKAGLTAEITTFANGAQVSTGVAGGALDVGISSVITLANASLRGLPFVYVAGGGLYNAAAPTIELCVAKDGPVRELRDLAGKTVAISGLKDITHLALVVTLQRAGVDPAKVNVVEMPFSQVGAALQRGTVAAGTISEPSLSAALDAGEVRLLARSFDAIGRDFMIGGWFANGDWVRKNPAVAKRFADVIYETARWANANHDKSAAILQKYTKIDDATVKRMTRVTYATKLDAPMIASTLDLAAKEKFTERAVAPSEMIARV